MYAIIENNVVTDILRVDPHTIYPASYASRFEVVPNGIERGWIKAGGVLVAPAIDLAAVRAELGERIKAERDRRKFAGVKVGTDWFHSDLESRSQWERMANKTYQLGLTGADAYTIGGQPMPWKTMAGTFVVLTAGKIFAVVDAIELQEALIFGCAQQHITAVQASATPESYDFSTGWPVSFEDGV